jgi:small GTP-binding protein
MNQPAIKVVLIGDSFVGKTCIFRRLESKTYDPRHASTIGGAFLRLPIDLLDGTETDIGLWDTAGQEKFRTIVPMYFQKVDILLVVFDLTNPETFANVDSWINLAKENAPPEVQIILIGNKSDLATTREVQYNEGQSKANSFGGSGYIEMSALNGQGFDS